MTPTRTRTILAALAAATLLLLAGCGDDAVGSSDVATIDGTDGGGSAPDDGGDDELTAQEREDAMLEFAECMREHGVDVPDPRTGGDGEGIVIAGPGPGGEGPGADPEAFEAADEACSPILEDAFEDAPPVDPEEEARRRDEMLAFAECMREHGIDMPDPTFGEGGRVQIGGPPGEGEEPTFDPASPEFRAAEEECGDVFSGDGPRVAGGSTSAAEEGE